jgi:hypothetical protein
VIVGNRCKVYGLYLYPKAETLQFSISGTQYVNVFDNVNPF